MKRMRKLVTTAIIILSACVIIFNACGEREAIALPSDIADRIIEEIDMPLGVMVNDVNIADTGQLASALMGEKFDPLMFDGFAMYPPITNSDVSEFGIFKVKNEADIGKAQEIIRRRMNNIKDYFSDDVRSDEYKTAGQGEIRTDGKYIFYSLTKDNDRIFRIISEMLNDK